MNAVLRFGFLGSALWAAVLLAMPSDALADVVAAKPETSEAPKLIRCDEPIQKERIAHFDPLNLPLPATLQFSGQFVIPARQNCSNTIEPGPKLGCKVCSLSAIGDAQIKLSKTNQVSKIIHSAFQISFVEIYFTSVDAGDSLKLVCKRPIDSSGFRDEPISMNELCSALENLKPSSNGEGVHLRSKQIQEIQGQPRNQELKEKPKTST